jgi:polyvinyl alcohol dehydrogenase (cytochrome)
MRIVRQTAVIVAAVGVILPAAASAQAPSLVPPGQALYTERCAACHDVEPTAARPSKAPARAALVAMGRAAIVAALSAGGSMAPMATGLTAAEKTAIAAFLSPSTPLPIDPSLGRCTTRPLVGDAARRPQWNGWGNGPENARFQPAAAAGLTPTTVAKLTLKWAFGLPGVTAVSGQPTVFGGRVLFGTESGTVFALDAATGCIRWRVEAGAGVRSAISVGPLRGNGLARYAAYFGDVRANVHAVDFDTGASIWAVKVEEHAAARITGAPTLAGGRLYVPVSSIEEVPGPRPDYPCCTFRGSVVALDAESGARVWKTYTIAETPAMVGKNAAGTPMWKPAGAAVWAAPTVDIARGRLYIATGNAYTEPAAPTSDAVIALSLESGAIEWVSQVTPADAYLVGCTPGNANCPVQAGPDFDFGNSPILRRLANGRSVIVIGQKSGIAYGMDPDKRGAVLWRYRAGRGGELGGLEWGSAADERVMYVPVSDVMLPNAGGLHAVSLSTGERLWNAPPLPPRCTGGRGCAAAQSAAITVIPGVVFSGTVDGHLRAYDARDGRVLWAFDTLRDFETVNGVPASGGSIDGPGPTVAGGMVFTGSGYGRWLGRAGNVLLAFALP